MQQRMLDRYKEMLEVTDDAEWKAMQPLVKKVMDAAPGYASAAWAAGCSGAAARVAATMRSRRDQGQHGAGVVRHAQPGSRSVAEGD